ncbi:MAG: DNA translocase FtsK [Eubacteriales bacterium]|nr:DNA translocase FtsK [Eubacteriales bacterium]
MSKATKKTSKSTKKAPVKNAKQPSAVNIKAEKQKMATERKPNPAVPYVIGFFALFVILTFFVADSGFLGKYIRSTLRGLFGVGYYYFPFLLLLIAFYWKRDSVKGAVRAKIILGLINFIFLLIIYNTIVAADPYEYGWNLFEIGKTLDGSGLFGGNIGALFVKMLGKVPTLILSSLAVFISTVFLFGSTPKSTVKAIIDFFREIDFGIESDTEDNLNSKATVKAEEEEAIKQVKGSYKTAPVIIPDEVDTSQQRFELPLEEEVVPSFPERELVGFKEINREMPWDEPVSVQKPENAETTDSEDSEKDGFTIDKKEEVFSEEEQENPPYVFPPISLLAESESDGLTLTETDIQRTSQKLVDTLASFGVHTRVISTSCGPTITRYELQPETGVRVKSIANLADDIALHLATTNVRIETIPGKAAVGIEIPNRSVTTVRLHGLLNTATFRDNKSSLFCALGMDVAGNPIYIDIGKMPHLLIAGATGMGKSVCINSIIISLLYRAKPDEVKLILIDPKRIELSEYNGIPHLMVPVITEPKKAAGTLNWACIEMEKRYTLIQEVGVRNLAEYNSVVRDDPERETIPYVVIIIDELADLMMTAPDDVETSICRLAQQARAAGMHLVVGTQRPSVDVITGLIKANIPSRIAFTVASQVDSRTILDMAGAEKLMGRGDMLYYPVGAMKPVRVQGAFVDGKTEVTAITQFIKDAAEVQYNEEVINMIEQEAKLCGVKHSKRDVFNDKVDDEKDDPMIISALEVAFDCGNVSTSLLQRRLSLGYARAARIVDKLERRGYVGQFDAATKKRAILITKEEFLELKLNSQKNE